jgi:hypothetical protein
MPTRFELGGTTGLAPVEGLLDISDDVLMGLQEGAGTFSLNVTDDVADPLFGMSDGQPVTVFLYSPKVLPWYRHWWALFAERFLDRPYPTDIVKLDAVVAGKPEVSSWDGDDIVVSGRFRSNGTAEID